MEYWKSMEYWNCNINPFQEYYFSFNHYIIIKSNGMFAMLEM